MSSGSVPYSFPDAVLGVCPRHRSTLRFNSNSISSNDLHAVSAFLNLAYQGLRPLSVGESKIGTEGAITDH